MTGLILCFTCVYIHMGAHMCTGVLLHACMHVCACVRQELLAYIGIYYSHLNFWGRFSH